MAKANKNKSASSSRQKPDKFKQQAADYLVFADGSHKGETELVPITDTLKDNYMPYAMSVIISRAIPEIDGFKPSQRKLLYTMYRMGLTKDHRAKCADIVGQAMAFNPHGDQTIYETMVRMTRGNEALIHPWIDSKGNMGKVYSRDMQYAAYRYTEAKLDQSWEILFKGLEKDAVDFVDNYSATMKEPVLLPAAIPTVLINANQGIAVGMASNICSFNLAECCLATRALIFDPKADILEIMPAPDFSTGANIIYDPEQMAKIYETGRGSFKLQAKMELFEDSKRIEISEIPYSTSVEAIIEDISKQIKSGKLKEIVDVRDETDLNGLRITLDLKKNADLELACQKLNQMTSLVSSFACNFNILVNNHPQLMGAREILLTWLDWRRVCLSRELTFDKTKLEERLHLLRALESVLLDIDRAIRIIRQTEKEDDVIPHLMAAFKIDQVQAEYVAEIKLRQLNREYLLRRTKDIAEIEDQISDLEAILKSPKRLDKLIADQLSDYANRYGKARKTQLLALEHLEQIKIEPQIEDYNLKLFFTRDQYLKKIPLTSLRSAGDLKLKEDDEIIQEIEISNCSEILFFSDRGNTYKLMTHELDDHKPSQFGDYVPNLLELEKGESIRYIVATKDFSGYLLLVFADGRAVKLSLDVYETKNRRKKLLNAFYDKADLMGLFYAEDLQSFGDLAMISSKPARMILLDSNLVPLKKTRNSQGAQMMKLKDDQRVRQVLSLNLEQADELSYYRVRSLPAAGRYLQDDFILDRQLSFDL